MFLPQAQQLTFVRPWGQWEWNPGLWVVGATLFRYVCERKTWTEFSLLCSALHFSPALPSFLIHCFPTVPSLTVPSLTVPFLTALPLSVSFPFCPVSLRPVCPLFILFLPSRPFQSRFLLSPYLVPPCPLPSRPALFGPFSSLTVLSLRVPFLAVLSLSVPSLYVPS